VWWLRSAAFALALWIDRPAPDRRRNDADRDVRHVVGRTCGERLDVRHSIRRHRNDRVALGGIVVATFGYVAGIALFEGFVADVVPYDVPAAVGPLWVAAVLAGVSTGVVIVAFTPGPRGAQRCDVAHTHGC
jgi:hypothetical protein